MAVQELILDASELSRLVLECGRCTGRAVIPVEAEVDEHRLASLCCPSCGNRFSETLPLFHAIHNFYDEVQRAARVQGGVRVRFVLKVPTQQQG